MPGGVTISSLQVERPREGAGGSDCLDFQVPKLGGGRGHSLCPPSSFGGRLVTNCAVRSLNLPVEALGFQIRDLSEVSVIS